MARPAALPSKSSIIAATVLVLLFFLVPAVLESYPVTGSINDVLAWAGDKFMLGLAALALIGGTWTFVSLARDAHRWLNSVPEDWEAPTPAALEDGTLRSPHAIPGGGDADADSPPASSIRNDPIIKVLRAALTVGFIASQLVRREVVSLGAPLLDNAGATLLFLLRGFEVLFVVALLLTLLLVCWAGDWRCRYATAALETTVVGKDRAQPAQPVVDGGPTGYHKGGEGMQGEAESVSCAARTRIMITIRTRPPFICFQQQFQ
ncbi:hypothetical protein FB451DRAFT_1264532 [Mycena latifolia]|nr:hypothetical protein FB451DRAFT_1264532 [Mycena latifolia]